MAISKIKSNAAKETVAFTPASGITVNASYTFLRVNPAIRRVSGQIYITTTLSTSGAIIGSIPSEYAPPQQTWALCIPSNGGGNVARVNIQSNGAFPVVMASGASMPAPVIFVDYDY